MIQRVDPFSPSTSQTQLSKEQIEKILNEEKQKRTTALKKIVYKDIIFSELTKNQLHQLGIQMLSDEISILEYMIKISGHNIYQFANLEYKLIDYKIFNNVYKDIIDQADSAKKKNVFSIRGIISYKEGSRSFKKKWEMQLIREPENKFMIIGFIL
ncbi:MAG: hypothetical protein KKH98_00720 [Spirochaetes bacterium]|nr:hypothetical protein [Spirochaetota bacterium]